MSKEQILNENQFLDFSTSKVQSITLDQLRKTQREKDPKGMPLKGIYHYDLIDNVIDTANSLGYKAEVFDLFAAQNKGSVQFPGVTLSDELEKIYGQRAVQAHTLRRVFANIRLLDFDTDEYTTNLSIAFHQGGIQAGFGNNVIICHNQCMLSASQYAATYSENGGEKYDIPQMLELIKGWLVDARCIVENDRERIAKMKAITVPAARTLQVIGSLTANRVAHDSKNQDIKQRGYYPLNQSQISTFTEDLLLRHAKNDKVTVWDLYDAATNLYKADLMDVTAIMPQNRAFVEFLENEFAI